MKQSLNRLNSDVLGALTAFICVLHCAVAPILLALHTLSAKHLHGIWHSLDYFFVVVTLVAVFFAAKRSVNLRIATMLWVAAIGFVSSILLEESIVIAEYFAYGFSLSLIFLHLLNRNLQKKGMHSSK